MPRTVTDEGHQQESAETDHRTPGLTLTTVLPQDRPASATDILSVVGKRTVPDILRAGVERAPDRTLLIYDDLDGQVESYTWSEVYDGAVALASRLTDAGVRPGQCIHLHLPNRPEFLLYWFAAALLGAVIVPTNIASASSELEFIISHVGAPLSVTDADGLSLVTRARAATGIGGSTWQCDAVPALHDSSSIDDPALPAPDPLNDLAVMYTSGTTARPKGVRVTHANYIYAGESVAAGLGLTNEDRFLVVLPLFHANAQYYSVMSTLVSGGTIILTRRFSASTYVDTAIRHQATVGSLFAAPMRMILAKPSQPYWRTHRLRVVAFAQNITPDDLARWERTVGAPLLQLYGMTETIGPPLMNPLWGHRRHNALGRAALGYACRIVGDQGVPVAPGEVGELHVAGVPGISLMAGYLNDPDATDAVLSDGWLRTGDLVRQDDDGLLSFVGREKDMIKRAGENIAASEIEAVLLLHPAVADAAVIGAPDPMRDETIVAFVVLKHGAPVEERLLRDWCAERLATFRVPSFFALRSQLPRTAVGKVRKQLLREEWARRLA
jgi:crotonobetaine/carnitine-CoA ligase